MQAGLVLAGFVLALLLEVAAKLWLFYPIKGSYPSGHALRALFLATVIASQASRRWVRVGVVVLAALISLSRVYVGEHYSDEVIGGGLAGWALEHRDERGVFPVE